MYEHRRAPVLDRGKFALRLLHHGGMAAGVIAASLGIGMAGYHWLGDLPWIDSLENASMILTGMGPISPMVGVTAKLFASFYALFSGVVFLTTAALLVAPFVHRLLHRFHFEGRG
ncbi:MAG: hypothetical protein V1495_11035 [Pseudomonadota bacterium]